MSGPFTVRFDEPGAGEPSLVGGKGANLARLAAAGLPVPEGFCVTTAAFHALLDDPSLQQALQSLEGLTPEDEEAQRRAAADLRARFESRPLPEEARRAIEEALAACGLEHAYAVRSSATAEDLPEASFAGQQDTYLNVRGTESLLEKVRACMASLFTERATLYRARQGIPHSRVANAVVVQRMVRPDASGILFTADPLTGHRGVSTIDAGFGLGEALVSGKVTADLVRVDESSGRVLEYKTGDKRITIRPLPGGGSETVELPPEQRSARVLSEAEARTLMELGKEVEALQGSPQDVEWCREAGRFYVLQARPITSLFPLPSPSPRDGALHVYWSLSHKQSMPEAMPPLVLDLWRRLMPLGKPRGSPRLNPWSATAGGRLYADLNPFLAHPRLRRRLLQSVKATDELAWTALEELIHRPGLQRGQRVRLSELTPWLSLGGAPELFGLILQKPEGAAERERAWLDDYTRQATARIRAPTTLRARLQAMMEVLCESGLVLVRRAMPILLGHLAQTALERLFPEALDDVAALGRGFEEDAITRMNLALGDVADEARRHPAVAEALRAGRRLEEVVATAGGLAFRAAFHAFLAEYGFRATGEIDLRRPRWREEPTPLLQTLRGNLKHRERGSHREEVRRLERQAAEAARRLEEKAARGPGGVLRRALVHRLIHTDRSFLGIREHPKYGLAKLLAEAREQLLQAGRELVTEGALGEVDDVWFLELEELLEAVGGVARELRKRVAERRRTFEHVARMKAPRVMTSEGEIPVVRLSREGAPEGALVGTPVGGGVVEGVAHVMLEPGGASLEKGEILVAPFCDPGWTPLFLNASGLVVDVGGLMTHGSIVAREYGLPAVVSVADATRRIKTGQRIRVDGSRGFVELLDG